MTLKSVLPRTLALVFTVSCTSASFKGTWRNWGSPALVMKKKKVVVVALNMPRTPRLGVEAAATDELRHMGFRAEAAYKLRESLGSGESARAKLEKDGFEAAIVFRVTTNEKELFPTPGHYEPQDAFLKYWPWGGGWTAVPALERGPGKLYVETLVYSVRSDELVWSGVCESGDTSNVPLAARDLVRIAISDMRNGGLLL